jgi:hypothetical protein
MACFGSPVARPWPIGRARTRGGRQCAHHVPPAVAAWEGGPGHPALKWRGRLQPIRGASRSHGRCRHCGRAMTQHVATKAGEVHEHVQDPKRVNTFRPIGPACIGPGPITSGPTMIQAVSPPGGASIHVRAHWPRDRQGTCRQHQYGVFANRVAAIVVLLLIGHTRNIAADVAAMAENLPPVVGTIRLARIANLSSQRAIPSARRGWPSPAAVPAADHARARRQGPTGHRPGQVTSPEAVVS